MQTLEFARIDALTEMLSSPSQCNDSSLFYCFKNRTVTQSSLVGVNDPNADFLKTSLHLSLSLSQLGLGVTTCFLN